ncbi:MAG: flagellar filament capping protein FliD [Selenomonadaceae bacterium]|nr:flagellar filament capping protein FliD [Selenomonadaceae bacterium]
MGVNGIYGLSGSGLDIESMVKVGMMSKQNEYDKMAQKFTKNEWTKAAYLDVYSTVNTFNTSTLSQYKMSANMNAKNAESSSSSIKVTANASAAIMNHKVEVESLSSNAYLLSTNKLTRYNNDTGAVDANSSSIQLKSVLFKNISMDENGNVTGTANADSAYENVSAQKSDVGFSFILSDGTKAISDMSDEEKKSHTVSFTYEELLGSDTQEALTMNDLVSRVNALNTNVRAAYDSLNDSFSFYNKNGGEANAISISTPDTADSSVAATFFNGLGMYSSINGELHAANRSDISYDPNADTSAANSTKFFLDGKQLFTGTEQIEQPDGSTTSNTYWYTKNSDGSESRLTGTPPEQFTLTTGGTATTTGTDGSIKVDGITYKTTENKATVGGITYSALDKTSSPATVSVTQNTDAIVDKVKSFVEDYNKLLSGLYEKYDEKPNKDYKPLTQSQKDQMKEEQIEKWEEKAKAGLLYHDKTLGKIIDEMRSAISNTVEGINGKYNSAYSIGISTTGIKGQLTLDETKLRNALAEDSDAVYNVFAKLDANDEAEGNGIAQRLGDVMVTAAKNIRSKSGSTADITEDSDLNNLLRELQTKMSNFKKLMSSFEDKLYKKYDAMEVTLAKLGTQLNFIMGGNQ